MDEVARGAKQNSKNGPSKEELDTFRNRSDKGSGIGSRHTLSGFHSRDAMFKSRQKDYKDFTNGAFFEDLHGGARPRSHCDSSFLIQLGSLLQGGCPTSTSATTSLTYSCTHSCSSLTRSIKRVMNECSVSHCLTKYIIL